MIIVSSAIRRGGNHAQANWILPHLKRETGYVHNGNIESIKGIRKRIGDYPGADVFVPYQGLMVPIKLHSPNDNTKSRNNENKCSLLNGNANELLDREGDILYGVENHTPSRIREGMTKNDMKMDIFVQGIRSPWNNLASIMKYKGSLVKLENFASLWIEFAKEHLGETNFTEDLFDKRVFMNYDLWFQDKNYRIDLSEQLGMDHTDAGLEYVSHHGNGSSFDKTSENGSAQKMKVLDRWRSAVNIDEFRNILNDKELIELAVEIFGPPPF